MSESEIARVTRLQDQRNEAMAEAVRDRVSSTAREAAHCAYHAHNEACSCRDVGCLTRYMADAVLDAVAVDLAGLRELLTEGVELAYRGATWDDERAEWASRVEARLRPMPR